MKNQQSVYLNHAGTSWPKPAAVIEAAVATYSLDPAEWPDLFRRSHRSVADFFHVDPSRLLLTPSCTAAIGVGVLDHPWTSGDRVLSSKYEHHALHRALIKLSEQGVGVTTLPESATELIDLDTLESELQAGGVRLLALTAACNVTGQLLPVAEAVELAHRFGALVLVDGAQVAGWWDLNLQDLQVDLFTFAGHKGPHAPWGIGGLYVAADVAMASPLATCEIPSSLSKPKCAAMPGYCDTGSADLSSLAAMAVACDWLGTPERKHRLTAARGLAEQFTESVRSIPGVALHGDVPVEKKMPTVAISVGKRMSTDVAEQLRELGIIVSGGLQCAPQAHASLGTDHRGVIRFSFGVENQISDVRHAVDAVSSITSL